MRRVFQSAEDCADCICRVCARNSCNDSKNHLCDYKICECDCVIGDLKVEIACDMFLPDEESC